jgi:hypothetical protein
MSNGARLEIVIAGGGIAGMAAAGYLRKFHNVTVSPDSWSKLSVLQMSAFRSSSVLSLISQVTIMPCRLYQT